jgi:hypothetical protein
MALGSQYSRLVDKTYPSPSSHSIGRLRKKILETPVKFERDPTVESKVMALLS